MLVYVDLVVWLQGVVITGVVEVIMKGLDSGQSRAIAGGRRCGGGSGSRGGSRIIIIPVVADDDDGVREYGHETIQLLAWRDHVICENYDVSDNIQTA